MDELLAYALSLPETAEGVACAGTPLECRTATVKGKAFLFLARDHVRLKQGGAWQKLDHAALPPVESLRNAVLESYRALAPKRLREAAPSAGH